MCLEMAQIAAESEAAPNPYSDLPHGQESGTVTPGAPPPELPKKEVESVAPSEGDAMMEFFKR
jgi:hypothetical protein